MTSTHPYLGPDDFHDYAIKNEVKDDTKFLLIRREGEGGHSGEPKGIECVWNSVPLGIFTIPKINRCYSIRNLRLAPVIFANIKTDEPSNNDS